MWLCICFLLHASIPKYFPGSNISGLSRELIFMNQRTDIEPETNIVLHLRKVLKRSSSNIYILNNEIYTIIPLIEGNRGWE